MDEEARKIAEAAAHVDINWGPGHARRLYRELPVRAQRRRRARAAGLACLFLAAAASAAAGRWILRREASVDRGARDEERGLLASLRAPHGRGATARLVAPPSSSTGGASRRFLAFDGTLSGLAVLEKACRSLEEGQRPPIDGLIVQGLFTHFWDGAQFQAILARIEAPLRCLARHGLDDNFLHLTIDHVDWGDSKVAAAVQANARFLASFLRDLPVRGLLIDTQFYVFEQGPLALRADRPAADQEAVIRARARDLFAGLQEGGRPLEVLVTLGYSEAFRRACIEGQPLAQSNLALLPAFLDGLGDAATAHQGYVADIFLPSYPTRTPEPFPIFRELVHGRWDAAAALWMPGLTTYTYPVKQEPWSGVSVWPERPRLRCSSTERAKVEKPLEAGFGLMLDYEHDLRGGFATRPDEFSRNNLTPEALERTLRAAFASSDRYVWLFTGTVSIWKGGGTPSVPDAYLEAIRAARRD